MSEKPRKWGAFTVGRATDEGTGLRALIEDQRPDTRIFVDKLYEEFTESAGRSRIDRLIQDGGRRPWSPTGDEAR